MALADRTHLETGPVRSEEGPSSFARPGKGVASLVRAEEGLASVRPQEGVASLVRPEEGLATVRPEAGVASLVSDQDTAGAVHWAIDPLVPASAEALDLATVLHALSDPVRLRIVLQLADGGERTCGSLEVPVAKSTCSHHFRVLREAGVVAQRVDGKCRFNRLRSDVLEQRFPGLLGAVLRAQGPTDPPRA